jgi:hypothetical protein
LSYDMTSTLSDTASITESINVNLILASSAVVNAAALNTSALNS